MKGCLIIHFETAEGEDNGTFAEAYVEKLAGLTVDGIRDSSRDLPVYVWASLMLEGRPFKEVRGDKAPSDPLNVPPRLT